MGLIFVTGGAKSGKSKFAEEMLLKLNNGNQKNIYLATSLVFDEEMKEKVRLHKKRRKNDWFTVETYKNFKNKLYDFFEIVSFLFFKIKLKNYHIFSNHNNFDSSCKHEIHYHSKIWKQDLHKHSFALYSKQLFPCF